MEGTVLEKEHKSARELEERIESYIQKMEAYLNFPYIFELPPSDKKLLPGDENYDYYMCRPNVMSGPMLEIDWILEYDEDLKDRIDKDIRSELQRDRSIIKVIGEWSHKTYLDEQTMAILKGTIEDAVKQIKKLR